MGDRLLILSKTEALGPAEGGRFRVPSEFWFQLCLLMHGRFGSILRDVVAAEQAAELATAIEEMAGNESWQLHLYLWDDEGGGAVKSLVVFLRGGGFAVVEG